MNRLLVILVMFIGFLNAQAQSIDLSRSHDLIKHPIYVLDYLEIDSIRFFAVEFSNKDISSTGVKGDTIFVSTKLAIDFNGKLLINKKDKQVFFSEICKPNIKSIIKLNKEDALRKYGGIGKKGVLQIHTE
jgi:hypothetical protein